jgi:hypothetical protein
MTWLRIYLALLLLPLLTACSGDPLDVDVANVKVDIHFADFNEPIMYGDSVALMSAHHENSLRYPDPYAYLIGFCLQIGEVPDTAFYASVMTYRKDATIRQLHDDIRKKFDDTEANEAAIIDGFRHLRFHLPNCKIPKNIVYMNTLFQAGVFCTEEDLAIGLQNYLGEDNRVIKQLNPQFYFDWMKEGMDAKYLERDVLTGWIETHVVEETEGNLAEQIIRWGKILYLTEAAFPEESEALILRYSEDELKWAEENEYAFWKYLVDENLLFTVDDKTTRNMVGDGPFTPGLPEEGSPDRMGQYLGWRMLHSYMEQFDISVKDLIGLPYNDILQEFEIE